MGVYISTRTEMSQKIVTKTAISLLLPSSSSLPLILSEFLPSPQPSTTETTSPPSSEPSDPSSKFSSSVSAIGNLLSNKAKFLGDQSSLLGHQMEMLEKELSDRLAGLEEQLETKKEEEYELRERLQGLKSQDDFYT